MGVEEWRQETVPRGTTPPPRPSPTRGEGEEDKEACDKRVESICPSRDLGARMMNP